MDVTLRALTDVDVDGAPAGFVAVRWTEEGATPVGEVEMVAVAPARQRAGIESRLLERAVTDMRARGVPLAVIGTGGDDGHAPARALYQRHGHPHGAEGCSGAQPTRCADSKYTGSGSTRGSGSPRSAVRVPASASH